MVSPPHEIGKFEILKFVGCEGAESMLPALDALFEVSAKGESDFC
jgi:hypothetical protein